MTIKVIVRVQLIKELQEPSDYDDRWENPIGDYEYTIETTSDEEAIERALDQFHSTIPVACLEDFDITAEVLPPTGMEEG